MAMRFENGDKIYHVELNNMVNAHDDDGILNGLDVSPESGMVLNIAPGYCYMNNETFKNTVNKTVTVGTAHNLYPKICMICYWPYYNYIGVVSGEPAISPKPLDKPAHCLLLALVHLPANCTAIEADQIKDERIFVKPTGLIYTPSAHFIFGDDAEVYADNPTYTLMKEINIPKEVFNDNSELTIKFDMRSPTWVAVYGKIYRKGNAVGTERVMYSNVYYTFSEDISTWAAGDQVQLWGYKACSVRNLRIYGDIEPVSIYGW